MDELRDDDGDLIFDQPGSFECDLSMQKPLDSFVVNTDYFSRTYGHGYGNMEVIGHLGAQRPASGCASGDLSYHCDARALDIAWVQWSGNVASRPCNAAGEVGRSLTRHRRLVAVEAGLRKWFGYVVNRNIDRHHNHFHVDNGCPVALRLKTSSTGTTYTTCHYFLQDCIVAFTDFTDKEVPYDGDWGPKSKKGYKTLLSDLGMECLSPHKCINHYMLFLDYIMMHGFADKPAGTFRWG
ncbi:MAG: hypothetical protein OXI96_06260 [Acidimicrobiaceae bacterium]|nr:hypothetical protein [Acidimicrobiaceae bacterium]